VTHTAATRKLPSSPGAFSNEFLVRCLFWRRVVSIAEVVHWGLESTLVVPVFWSCWLGKLCTILDDRLVSELFLHDTA
jgi:hypothetical protein